MTQPEQLPANSETSVEEENLKQFFKENHEILLLLVVAFITLLLLLEESSSPENPPPHLVFDDCENGPVIEVEFGDTLHGMAAEVHADELPIIAEFAEKKLLEIVAERNPHIIDLDEIYPGQYITFPPGTETAEFALQKTGQRFPDAPKKSLEYLTTEHPQVARELDGRAGRLLHYYQSPSLQNYQQVARDLCIAYAYHLSESEMLNFDGIRSILADYEAWVRYNEVAAHWTWFANWDSTILNWVLENAGVNKRINPNIYENAVFLTTADHTANNSEIDGGEQFALGQAQPRGNFFVIYQAGRAFQDVPNLIDPAEDQWAQIFQRQVIQHEALHLIQDYERHSSLPNNHAAFLHNALDIVTLANFSWDAIDNYIATNLLDPRVTHIFTTIHQNSDETSEELYKRFVGAVVTGQGAGSIVRDYEQSRSATDPPFIELYPPEYSNHHPEHRNALGDYLDSTDLLVDFTTVHQAALLQTLPSN